jgi:hypothetical protein
MTEVLFILTTIFVAYVVYVIVNDTKTPAKTVMPQERAGQQAPLVVEQPKPQAIAKKAQMETSEKIIPAVGNKNTGKSGLRNPLTGEVATVYSNYRFTKRWIKEALVKEGLLEKIYKNNELDATVETKIKAALLQLETMDQYHT